MPFLKYLIVVMVLLITAGCNDGYTDPCPQSKHIMEDFYEVYKSEEGFGEGVGVDAQYYEYSFMMDANGFICSIGYQGKNSATYEMTIKNENDSILFTSDFSFSPDFVEFKEVGDIPIEANKIYTISRKCRRFQKLEQWQGKVIFTVNGGLLDTLAMPIKINDLSIVETRLYDNIEFFPIINRVIPFIDFGFVPE